jgi:hypothetical protein
MKANQLRLATKYLEAAIQFAQVDLSKLPGKGLDTAERIVQRIIHRTEPATQVLPGALDRRTLTALQARALELLRSIATPGPSRITIAGDLLLTFIAVREKDASVSVRVSGHALDRFQYQLIRLLEDAGVEKLLTCPAPDCGRIFLKVTKKRFCSQRCQSRIYMRQVRAVERADRDALTTKGARHGQTTRTR